MTPDVCDVRMIALDLDGTAMLNHTSMAPQVRAAIIEAIAAGIVVLPATGRQLAGVPSQFLSIPGVRYAISSNGAKVYDTAAGEAIYADCFGEDAAARLLSQLQQPGVLVGMYVDGRGYNAPLCPDMLAALPPPLLAYLRATRIEVPSLAEMLHPGMQIEKFTLLFTNPQQRLDTFAQLAQRSDISTTSSTPDNLEVNTSTANKGAALVALGQSLGIPPGQIMAVGDGLNDIDMLRSVGWGVAMGNAAPQVKAVARLAVGSCKQHGAAQAIRMAICRHKA